MKDSFLPPSPPPRNTAVDDVVAVAAVDDSTSLRPHVTTTIVPPSFAAHVDNAAAAAAVPQVVSMSDMFNCAKANAASLVGCSPDDLVGNATSRAKIRDWLVSVCCCTSEAAAAESSSNKRLLFLAGPPGCGKSTTLSVLARDLGLNVVTVEGHTLTGEAHIRDNLHPLINRRQSSVTKSSLAATGTERGGTVDLVVVENACDEVINKGCFSALVQPFRQRKGGRGSTPPPVAMVCVVNEASQRIRGLQRSKTCDLLQMYAWSLRDMKQMVAALKTRYSQSLRFLTDRVLVRFLPKCSGDPRWCLLQMQVAAGRASWLNRLPSRAGQSSLWDAVSQILFPVVDKSLQSAYACQRTSYSGASLADMQKERLAGVLSLYFENDNSAILREAVWRNRTQALKAALEGGDRRRQRRSQDEWLAIVRSAEMASDADVLHGHDARTASFQLASYVGILGVFGVARCTQFMRNDVWSNRPQQLQLSARKLPDGAMAEISSFPDWHNKRCVPNRCGARCCRCVGFRFEDQPPPPPHYTKGKMSAAAAGMEKGGSRHKRPAAAANGGEEGGAAIHFVAPPPARFFQLQPKKKQRKETAAAE